ncbi:MAG: N-acetylmuramoyl-L-alanine amidase [Actinobacteria bacterium]|nr:N-acetylmuramoyl-L-alanine amidase [Actinomycetota bacterium]
MTDLIREGDRSKEVADVQSRLRALGYKIEDEGWFFGPSTTAAVRAFQQDRSILVDGIVGPDTWNQIVEASWYLGDRDLYLKHPPMRGDDIASLQARLNALGFDAGKEDGIFGVATDRAVRAFQKEYGVAGDGIFGLVSHAALMGLRVDRPGTSAHLREELRRMEKRGIAAAMVVIDPGHGGDDRGAVTSRGTNEADTCWAIATRLADRLASLGAKVRFTRTEPEAPDMSERAMRANEVDADVFLSIHLNEHAEPTAEGTSTYYFGGSRAGENLAEQIQEQLVQLGLRDCRSHARSYPVLRETRMPAVLVEPIFITNPDEAKRLEDHEFLSSVADAIAAGVRRFFELAETR